MSKRTAYIGGGNDGSVFKLFEQKGFKMVDDQSKAEFLVWTGGCDINPKLYGHKSIDDKPYYNNLRDRRELDEWSKRHPDKRQLESAEDSRC